ncbi:MAG: hypothetical protein JSV91_16100 [Phycisphaerales bacterium]|nr:MAG: hypothetical protein JSV91_16100 [Phycisphaerales bacterium]
MGRRYVFWRTPKGTASKGAGDQYSPRELLAKVGTSWHVDQHGQLTSSAGLFPLRLETVVRSSLVVLDPKNQELNQVDTAGIVDAAIRSLIKQSGGGTPIQPGELIAAADREAAKYFRRPSQQFLLVTTLSVAQLPFRRIRVLDCEVEPLKDRERYQVPSAVRKQLTWRRAARQMSAANYQGVVARTAGRTPYEAAERALAALNLARGFWTLFATRGAWSLRFGIGREAPLGVVHLGAIHTLHSPDGSPVEDIFWYEPDFPEGRPLFNPPQGWGDIEKNRRWAMRRVASLPYGSDLEDLIQRYAVALDQTNLSLAFLQMWAILEKLSNTIGASYDETLDRVSWIFADRRLVRGLAQSLRCLRNRFVHKAVDSQERDQIAYITKDLVEPHLIALLRNDYDISSLQEYGEFLSLPTSSDVLERRIRHYRRAVQEIRKRDAK